MLVKNEALIGLAGLPVAALVFNRRSRALQGSLLVLVPALLSLMLARSVLARTAGAPYDEQYLRALSLERWPVWLERLSVVPATIASSFRNNHVQVFWLAFALLGIPMAWRRGGSTRVLVVWVVIYLLASVAIMIVTPNHVLFHVDTALHRLWGQMVIPAGVLLVDAVLRIWSDPGGLPGPGAARPCAADQSGGS